MSLILIAAAAAALVQQGDEANERYVSCMFAVAREQPRSLPADELGALLRNSCAHERESLRAVISTVQQQRGVSAGEAEAQWNALVEQGIANIAVARAQVRTAAR